MAITKVGQLIASGGWEVCTKELILTPSLSYLSDVRVRKGETKTQIDRMGRGDRDGHE